ncbi:hypothetical protein EDD21DRAFT_350814 [Dissophora ornata]|nr:hypothetical protein EDD21DRAFT_350814 [Dissophora ornata]
MAPADSEAWGNPGTDTWGVPGTDTWREPNTWGEPVINSWEDGTEFTDSSGSLISALSRSPAGVTPPRWVVDMSFHEIGLKAHSHIFYIVPKEDSGQDPIHASCQTCFKECTIEVSSGNGCTSRMHHLHTTQEAELTVSECCHCGLTVRAVLEQATIPQSLIYGMRTNRKPNSSNTSAPHFHETLTMLIRILHDVTQTKATQTDLAPKTGINTKSAAFKSKIGMDDAMYDSLS